MSSDSNALKPVALLLGHLVQLAHVSENGVETKNIGRERHWSPVASQQPLQVALFN